VQAHRFYEVDGVAGEPIVLPFGPGPAILQRWTFELPPGVHRLPDSPAQTGGPGDPGGDPGDPPGSRYRLVAEAGRHTVIARFGAPRDAEPAIVAEIRLDVHDH